MDFGRGKNLGSAHTAAVLNTDLQGGVSTRGSWCLALLASIIPRVAGASHLRSYKRCVQGLLHGSVLWWTGYELFWQADCAMIYDAKCSLEIIQWSLHEGTSIWKFHWGFHKHWGFSFLIAFVSPWSLTKQQTGNPKYTSTSSLYTFTCFAPYYWYYRDPSAKVYITHPPLILDQIIPSKLLHSYWQN